jgi:hypothetical protein
VGELIVRHYVLPFGCIDDMYSTQVAAYSCPKCHVAFEERDEREVHLEACTYIQPLPEASKVSVKDVAGSNLWN